MAKNHVRAAIGLLAVCFFTLSARAASISYSGISFRFVDHSGLVNISVLFEDALIDGELKNISVPLKSVEIIFNEEKSDYVTLNVLIPPAKYASDLQLTAEKAEVVVRRREDFLLWKRFLKQLKEKQETEKRRREEPQRVLPPKDVQ